ncbi:head maturation protease, ClpP-related [Nocardioides lianchengensis]|uniref:ATP-dependent Clp protease proteolytic subunit n=1 Tax=Nocardioides lianchengensis TaxID=1045774 RepID=A0A1G6LT50_9ACTN|nr:head maturation protease, ClpP-related [Nocardioides lianchengensis]NYG12466.1 ATP-dependent protease ClpP protease subunit [Nocardioides lianchengensis]SDC45866.1 ATP-dependent protease ClpP, protease subunit [Nocardioides lianchengensis]
MSTKSPTKRSRLRTAAALKADAALLLGQPSRAALAAADDDQAPQPAPDSGELWLYGPVGGWWRGFNAESVAEALRSLDVGTLYVRIHSPGGYAPDGIAIANLLRNHRAKVIVVVDGLAASAASVIAIAGDEIVMCPGSQMMLHDASTYGYGNAAELRRQADWIDGQSENYAGVYQYKAGGTVAQWREVMLANDGTGTWYTAEGAVSANLATEVGTRTAVGSPPTAPDEDDFDDEDILARLEHDLRLLEAVPPAALAAWQGQPIKPPTASAGGTTQPEGAAVVDFNDTQIAALREQVGFPADADADTIVAAVTEALAESADPKVTTQVPEGMKLVSATVFDDVTAKAERGAKAAEELLTMQTNSFLDRFKDRFPPTDEARAKWAADFRRDPAGTEKYLSAAAPLVPTGEIGHGDVPATAGGGATTSLAEVREDPGYKSWEI